MFTLKAGMHPFAHRKIRLKSKSQKTTTNGKKKFVVSTILDIYKALPIMSLEPIV